MDSHPRYTVAIRQGDLSRPQRQPLSLLRKIVQVTLKLAPCHQSAALSLTLTTDRVIQSLNRRYRGQDKATDVLAFALEEGEPWPMPPEMPRHLGDVVVSLETTFRQAGEFGNSPASELAWVICHGTLHLLGYDHQDFDQLRQMRSREREILNLLGIEREWPDLRPEAVL